jgi:hypothetical protein
MIIVDLQGLIPQQLLALLGTQFMDTVLDDVAASARAKWILLAQQRLGSSKRDYIDGIQDVEGSGKERSITLVGWLPNAVEQGIDSYDLRTTLLGPGKGKTAKDGHKYRPIPFRHGTPGSGGQAGTPMGARLGPQGGQSFAYAATGIMDKAQAAKLGKAIYARARALEQGQRLGTRKGTGYVPIRESRDVAQVMRVPKLAPWHKTDIFAGMQRDTKTYERATQAQYTTFRTISEAKPDGWIHPGIQARHLAAEVEEHVQGLVGKAVLAAVRAAAGQLGTTR